MSARTAGQRFMPLEQRGCRNCKHSRNLDRGDRCYPWYVCRLDEMTQQNTLGGMPAIPERQATYRCDCWELANDE